MRARDTGIGADESAIEITFEGRPLSARHGETIAAALTANGEACIQRTAAKEDRGLFCGMGVCQDCLVEVDGRPNQRACMTKIDGVRRVRRQSSPAVIAPSDPAPPAADSFPKVSREPDVLVIGGGAGGLSAAAVAAEAGADVVLIDERPLPGGQFYKQPHERLQGLPTYRNDGQFADGRHLIERVSRAGVRILSGVVWNLPNPSEVMFFDGVRASTLRPERLVVATGAYERGHPVPGWTLPGVMTTGAAQTLLRSYGVLPGKRILVAGNGPLNLQVACELVQAGAEVLAVAEIAPRPGLHSLGSLWRMLCSAPNLLAQGQRYLYRLKQRGVPLHYGTVLARVERTASGLRVTLKSTPGMHDGREIVVDAVLMGYGFMPSNEGLRLLGCGHDHDARRGHLLTRRDAHCRTTVDRVFAVGDCCGLGGAGAALAEGVIAGLTAAADCGHPPSRELAREAARARRALARQRRFQAALWTYFQGARPVEELADPTTVLCRCEEITLAEVEEVLGQGFQGMSEIKRLTRLGMGRCQGRYCAPVLAEMLHKRLGRPVGEFSLFAPRPPLKMVPLSAIVEAGERDQDPAP